MISRVYCRLAILCLLTQVASAQDTGTAAGEAVAPSDSIVIADEPKGIDPASLLPDSLGKKINKSFADESLSDVAEWISEQAGLPVILNQASLDILDILPSEPVEDELKDAPLHLLLDRLSKLNVHWRLNEGIVHLESVETEHLDTNQYNIGELIDKGFAANTIRETIEDCVEPESWEPQGGSGSIILLGDVMFVRQVHTNHLSTAGLLQALRQFGRRTFALDPPIHEIIREQLNSKVNAVFNNIPLSEVAKQLGEEAGVIIQLNVQALASSGVRARQPVSLNLKEQPLKLALDLVCRQLDVTWQIRHGVLEITNSEGLSLETAVYDVRDLCRNDSESQALLAAMMEQTSPEQWFENGGQGKIRFSKAGVMVVYQTQECHEEVLLLLENYRTALRASKPREAKEKSSITTRFYKMPTDVADELELKLPILVAADSWQSEKRPEAVGTIVKLKSWAEPGIENFDGEPAFASLVPYSVLMIHQTAEVHAKIASMLSKIQYGERFEFGKSSGGMGGFGGGFFRVLPEPHKSRLNR